MKTMKFVISSLLVVAVALPACGFLESDSVEVEIRTDHDSYVPAPDDAITLTVTNRSVVPLYFVCTGTVELQELAGGLITRSWNVSGAEQCGRVTLMKGETAVRSYVFDQDSNLESISDARYDGSVRYRFRFKLFTDLENQDPIDEEHQYSNEFSMVKATVIK